MESGSLLILLQLFDSQFPVGNFAYSNGIEAYAAGPFDPADLEALLRNELGLGWGRLDLSAAALAWEDAYDAGRLQALGGELDAWKNVEVTRQSSVALGRRMLTLSQRLYPAALATLNITTPHQALVVGAVSRRLQLPREETLLAYGQGQLTASLAAAVRCMSLSSEHAHTLLVRLHTPLSAAVEQILADPVAALFSSTPALDLRRHEQTTLITRLFRS